MRRKKDQPFIVNRFAAKEIKRLLEMGKTESQIAIRTGYKISFIQTARKELGI